MNCENCIHHAVCALYTYSGYASDECVFYETRPRGKWLTTPNPNYSPFDSTSEVTYVCSKCTYSSGERITAYWNFCPNCGADMRKEGEVE